VLILVNSYADNKIISGELIILLIITVISFSFSFFSTGNNLRAASSFPNDHNLFFSLINSITLLFKKIIPWTFLTPIIPVTIILIPVLNKIVNNEQNSISKVFSVKPVYSLLLMPAFLFVQNFMVTWNTGTLHYGRTLNISYLIFLFLWFFNVIVILNYIKVKNSGKVFRIPMILNVLSYFTIIIFLFFSNNIKTAYSEVISGEAKRYNSEFNERYETIRNSKEEDRRIDKISNVPQVFFLYDITEDPNHIYNLWYREFFNKGSIALKKSEK